MTRAEAEAIQSRGHPWPSMAKAIHGNSRPRTAARTGEMENSIFAWPSRLQCTHHGVVLKFPRCCHYSRQSMYVISYQSSYPFGVKTHMKRQLTATIPVTRRKSQEHSKSSRRSCTGSCPTRKIKRNNKRSTTVL